MKLTGGNPSTSRKTCISATLSTTNPKWREPGSNPGLRGGRLATRRLSHGMAQIFSWLSISQSLPTFEVKDFFSFNYSRENRGYFHKSMKHN
jgi:hypothetical protein